MLSLILSCIVIYYTYLWNIYLRESLTLEPLLQQPGSHKLRDDRKWQGRERVERKERQVPRRKGPQKEMVGHLHPEHARRAKRKTSILVIHAHPEVMEGTAQIQQSLNRWVKKLRLKQAQVGWKTRRLRRRLLVKQHSRHKQSSMATQRPQKCHSQQNSVLKMLRWRWKLACQGSKEMKVMEKRMKVLRGRKGKWVKQGNLQRRQKKGPHSQIVAENKMETIRKTKLQIKHVQKEIHKKTLNSSQEQKNQNRTQQLLQRQRLNSLRSRGIRPQQFRIAKEGLIFIT